MFPISSSTLTTPGIVNFPAVAPTVQAAPVAPLAQVGGNTVTAVGTATDAPAQASVTVDLSPVASFLLTVSQSQQQITQLQAAVANGDDPQDAAIRASALNDATQNVVNAFNLLPSVDFDQAQRQGPSLLNNLVQSLTRQTDATQPRTAAQSLARIGVTLQPPLLSDLSGGLSLDNEVLRAAFNTDRESTTSTLQNTLATFNELATRFAEQLSAAGSAQLPALGTYQQQALDTYQQQTLTQALTPADIAANARLDLARAELDLVSQIGLPETAADRLAAQRANLEQPANTLTQTRSPIVNPLQASTAEVIAAQNAEAARVAIDAATRADDADASAPALQADQADAAQSALRTDQAARAAQTGDTEQANGTTKADEAVAQGANQLNGASQSDDAAAQASDTTTQASDAAQAAADAARATAAAQAARQQSASGLGAVTTAGAQAAAQANIAQAAAANAAANNPANATDAQQAIAAQTAATNVAAANAAATAASAQAQAAQNAANALAAQNNAALAAAAQARVAQSTAGTPEAAAAAAAVAAQQASAAQTTAANLAAANAAAAQASQQALAAQAAAAQAASLQLDPLRANPALAAAIAAYNISDPAVLGANARAAQTTTPGIPRVAAVGAATATGGIGARL
jgi:hypothetical protein